MAPTSMAMVTGDLVLGMPSIPKDDLSALPMIRETTKGCRHPTHHCGRASDARAS